MVNIIATPTFIKAYQRLSSQVQSIVDAKIQLLASNPAHPSFQVHRLRRAKVDHLYNCSISTNKRVIYQLANGTIHLMDEGEHDAIVKRVHERNFVIG